jgi:hypothetical protein
MIPTLPRGQATQLLIIRTALLLGLLLFGASTWYAHRRGTLNLLTPDKAQLFGYIFTALAGTTLAALFFLRARLGTAGDTKQLMSMYIIGYAFTEGTALFGGVVWFLGGSSNWFIAGLVLMIVSFQVLPVRRPA